MNPHTQQEIFCNICRTLVDTTKNILSWQGRVCSQQCFLELEWRLHLSMLGVEYRPKKIKTEYYSLD